MTSLHVFILRVWYSASRHVLYRNDLAWQINQYTIKLTKLNGPSNFHFAHSFPSLCLSASIVWLPRSLFSLLCYVLCNLMTKVLSCFLLNFSFPAFFYVSIWLYTYNIHEVIPSSLLPVWLLYSYNHRIDTLFYPSVTVCLLAFHRHPSFSSETIEECAYNCY